MSPTEPVDPRRLATAVRTHVAALLQLADEEVPTDVPLAALGLDSIMVIGLQGMLEDDWGLYDFPIAPHATIDDLTARASRGTAGGLPGAADGTAVPLGTATGTAAPPGTPGRGRPVPASAAPTTFPAAALQRAYLVGRRRDLPLGGVAAHMYLEFDSDDLDLDRAQRSLRQLVDRHPMLRTVLHADGTLETLTPCPAYEIPVTDLRPLTPAQREATLDQVRAEKSHQLRPTDEWPLLDVSAARLTDRRTRLSVYLDFVVADAVSCLGLLGEWGALYRAPDVALPELPTTFAGWSREQATVDSGRLGRARAYWAGRIPRLPPAPELPVRTDLRDVVGARFARTQVRIAGADWTALRNQATARGLTTSVVLCAAYARTLAAVSRRPDFTLTLTLFNRPPVPHIEHVVGDFSSTTLLAVDAAGRRTFGALARGMQDRLWLDLQHRAMPGIAVLRELWKAGRTPLLPVVFTSLFEDFSGLDWLGENVYGVSETPQVYLDHQTFERGGDLVLQFDYVPELLSPELLAQMIERHAGLLGTLARDPGAWESVTGRERV